MLGRLARTVGAISRPSAQQRTLSSALPTTSRFYSKGIVDIIGCPVRQGQPRDGVEMGPSIMREGGLIQQVINEGWEVNDRGDLTVEDLDEGHPMNPKAKHCRTVGEVCKRLSEHTYEGAMNGNFQLTLGGDHSIAIGSVAGMMRARPETGVIWVDAHADINTPLTSGSGNVHGMSLAFLMGLDNTRDVPGFEWMEGLPRFLTERLVYIGLRDVDAGERRFIKELGIRTFTMHEIDRYGIGKVMEMAQDHVSARVDRPIHLSFDIDSVDPVFAPSTGTQVRGGLSYREAFYVAEAVADSGMLQSLDVVEVNPAMGMAGAVEDTVYLANGIASACLGNKII